MPDNHAHEPYNMQLRVHDLPMEALQELGVLAARLGGTVSLEPFDVPKPLALDMQITRGDLMAWREQHGFPPRKAWTHLVEKSAQPGPFYDLIYEQDGEQQFSLREANKSLHTAFMGKSIRPLGNIVAITLMSMAHERIAETLPHAPLPQRSPLLENTAVYNSQQVKEYGHSLAITYATDESQHAIQTAAQPTITMLQGKRAAGLFAAAPFILEHTDDGQTEARTMMLERLEPIVQHAETVGHLFNGNVRSIFTTLKYIKALRQQGVPLGSPQNGILT